MPTIYGDYVRYKCAHCIVERKDQRYPCFCQDDVTGFVSNEFEGEYFSIEKEEKGHCLVSRIHDDMRKGDEVDPIWGDVWTCACCGRLAVGEARNYHHVSYRPEKTVEVHPSCHALLTAHQIRPDLWPPPGDYRKFYHPPPVVRVKGSKPVTSGRRGGPRTPPSRLRAIWNRDH